MVVIGSGIGEIVAGEAASCGLIAAWIYKEPIGGTRINPGCVPLKTLIYPADVAATPSRRVEKNQSAAFCLINPKKCDKFVIFFR
ncbi:MAG: hypothetical protein HY730_01345 [Candidatus Tectomicrobia bacterium]|uniref:Uncharacterized protein n=1 Tax=Tectimicrobiota bacterium TaxID=2528274 RepID=A0A933LQ63_UNCTE|nr:hypothetical protein [Candidatus Tectomicrobia bacterium]